MCFVTYNDVIFTWYQRQVSEKLGVEKVLRNLQENVVLNLIIFSEIITKITQFLTNLDAFHQIVLSRFNRINSVNLIRISL